MEVRNPIVQQVYYWAPSLCQELSLWALAQRSSNGKRFSDTSSTVCPLETPGAPLAPVPLLGSKALLGSAGTAPEDRTQGSQEQAWEKGTVCVGSSGPSEVRGGLGDHQGALGV